MTTRKALTEAVALLSNVLGEKPQRVESFGSRLRRTRQQRQMTLQKLAGAIPTQTSYLWKLENGQARNPGLRLVHKLAHALDVEPGYLAEATPWVR